MSQAPQSRPAAVDFLPQRPPIRHWEALTGIALGWVLVVLGLGGGWPLAIFCLPLATLLLAAATGLLLWPGDGRLVEFLTLGAGLSLLPLLVALGLGAFAAAGLLAAAAVATWLAAGRISLETLPRVRGAPRVKTSTRAAARIGGDQALLAWFKLILRPPRAQARQAMLRAVELWEARLAQTSDLLAYHPRPPDLLKVESRERRVLGQDVRHIRWESGFVPDPGLPGGDYWERHRRNHHAHAWILEHGGKPRPWVLTIHGYRMGTPWLDLRAFEPALLHQKYGLNVASVVLPLHGPRRSGRLSGAHFLEGHFSDFIHAERQSQWDIRRLLSWLRLNRHAPAIGVYGLSLGGYNAALLAGLDDELACVVAGIPVFDMARTMWRHMPPAEQALMRADGLSEERVREILWPVSPGSFAPQLPPERLGIFAGAIDTLVWPDEALRLAAHWGGISPQWFPGAHLTFAGTAAQRACLYSTFAAGGLLEKS